MERRMRRIFCQVESSCVFFLSLFLLLTLSIEELHDPEKGQVKCGFWMGGVGGEWLYCELCVGGTRRSS